MKKVVAVVLGFLFLTGCNTTNGDKKLDMDGMINTIMDSIEFPAMMQADDDITIEEVIKLDKEEISEIRVQQQMITVNLNEIILIKPKGGKGDDVLAKLKARKQALIDLHAFYPGQLAAAENTVVGQHSGYLYLICHEQAPLAEEALIVYMDKAE